MTTFHEMMMTATGRNSLAFSGMRRRLVVCSVFFLGFLFSASVQAVTLSDNAGLTMELGTDGSISGVSLNGITQPNGTGGGFYLMEPNSSTKIPMAGSVVSNAGNFYLTLTNSLQAKVTATLTQGAGFIEVSGVLEDLTGTDRGLWLGFNVPVNTLGWKWGHNLSGTNQVITSGAPGYSGDERFYIPIPAVWTNTGGIALCIPPTDPCVFENSADANGVRIRMAYGLSPVTTNFPSKAPFRFRIYSIDGTWGFRDALAKYYDWYPDYYTLEPGAMKRLNHRRDWLTMNYEDEGPSDKDQSSIASPELGEWCAYTKITARPQNMTGVDLTTISPTNTQAYLAAIAACTDIMHYGRKVLVNNSKLVEARAAISNCVVYHPDGSWSMEEPPEINSLDIGHNVSPYLYNGARTNYGTMYLRRPGKLIGFEPKFTFMHWDRLGGRSQILNYRSEHFPYTAHPLTFDQLGRLCLPTQFSNYELFDVFRLQFKQGGMFHEGAGMKDFNLKHSDEAPGGQDRVGMFWISSVMAGAWTEGGEKYHALGEYDAFRIFMGRKSYRIACDEVAQVAMPDSQAYALVKRAMANAIAHGFACSVANPYFYATNHPLYPATGSLFYTPAHQALWTNYIPASEAIRLAGWEPVTRAYSSSPLVGVQRFGHGQDIYLTVGGPTNLPATVDIDIEAAALGVSSNSVFSEMLAGAPLTIVPSARGFKVTVSMEQDMTRVIKIHSAQTGYPLTVNGGSGSGSYTNGQQVVIVANAMPGSTFVQWIGDTQVVNNVTYTNALVTMPTNAVTLTATYFTPGLFPPTVSVSAATGVTTNAATLHGSVDSDGGAPILDQGFFYGNAPGITPASTQVSIVVAAPGTNTFTTPGTYTWACPRGVTSIQVECWGGGGAGGSANKASGTANVAAGGGAGGAYAKLNTYAVSYSNTYFIHVGEGGVSVANNGVAVSGGDSWFNNVNSPSSTIIAKGGGGAQSIDGSAGNTSMGGSTLAGSAGVVYSGGSGATSVTGTGGGGGGSGGPGSVGNPGVATVGVAAAAVTGGGNGGASVGGNNLGLAPTIPPGGGGSGGRATGAAWKTGGSGAAGQVVITYGGPQIGPFDFTLTNLSPNTAIYYRAYASNSVGITLSSETNVVTMGNTNMLTITATAGVNGSVAPTGVIPVAYGSSTNFVITASNYYRIATLKTNNADVIGMSFDNNSTTANFTWSNVTEDGTLAATFAAQVVTNAPAQVPYEWLAGYGLTNYNTDAEADQDFDGLKAWQEYIAGTDPTNTASGLMAAQNNRNVVTWNAVSGRLYSVYWSTNLINGFQPLETNIPWPQGSYTNATPDPRVNHYQIKVRMD